MRIACQRAFNSGADRPSLLRRSSLLRRGRAFGRDQNFFVAVGVYGCPRHVDAQFGRPLNLLRALRFGALRFFKAKKCQNLSVESLRFLKFLCGLWDCNFARLGLFGILKSKYDVVGLGVAQLFPNYARGEFVVGYEAVVVAVFIAAFLFERVGAPLEVLVCLQKLPVFLHDARPFNVKEHAGKRGRRQQNECEKIVPTLAHTPLSIFVSFRFNPRSGPL